MRPAFAHNSNAQLGAFSQEVDASVAAVRITEMQRSAPSLTPQGPEAEGQRGDLESSTTEHAAFRVDLCVLLLP